MRPLSFYCWVYREPEKEAIVDATVLALPEKRLPVVEQESSGEQNPQKNVPITPERVTEVAQNNPPRRKLALPSRDCILLAAAYLFGTLLAGVLQALCDTAERETLTYYLHCWQDIFAASTPAQAVGLFGAELAVVVSAAIILLLLGLSGTGKGSNR